ncbi:MAG TPA: DUF2760 domain-containing protein [Lentisphaeria bacterium]|nr:DUF2760 domain-containing protein [Lentisphaerota bacterium]OQC13007.1 MAG: hypothetical protein BWX73_02595 [Lentisphaerae bacterium ADurb.Bin082]HPY91136.1 DUF2760 domain-containing protein [Lentisphaeria bacterium]
MGNFRTAWSAFWTILKSSTQAEAWKRLQASQSPDATAAKPAPDAPTAKPAPDAPAAGSANEAAVYTLTLLQREARLVDFLQEDISPYSDEQVGAAVRKIHADCRRALDKYFHIEPIRSEPEQSRLDVPEGFDARRLRVTGRSAGQPPFAATLIHRGWVAAKIDLPQRSQARDPQVICPAEVEVQ